MPNMPEAEVSLDESDITELVREQHPDLAALPVTILTHGWDNLIARLGEDLLVRLPRRAAAATLIVSEQTWLPILAPRLPLPIPAPIRAGRPSSSYPFAWSVTRYLPGGPLVDASGNSVFIDVAAAAVSLGQFLAALHQPAPTNAPVNAFRGIPLTDRRSINARNATAVAAAGLDVTQVTAAIAIGTAAAAWSGKPVWLHGDLHPANLLVADGTLSAVIDFGDITSGDPATDLAIVWMALPFAAQQHFWTAYSDGYVQVDQSLRLRTRAWAAAFALVYLANSADNRQMTAIGRAVWDRLQKKPFERSV